MKATYKTMNGRIMFEVTGETVKAVFGEIARIQEVFDAEHLCGLCNSPDIRLQHRHVDDFDYYELACKCGARFQFGQAKKGGGLFPKRKSEEGHYLPHRGWAKFQGTAQVIDAGVEPGIMKYERGEGVS